MNTEYEIVEFGNGNFAARLVDSDLFIGRDGTDTWPIKFCFKYAQTSTVEEARAGAMNYVAMLQARTIVRVVSSRSDEIAPARFEVQTLMGNSWENCWTESDGDTETATTFATRAEAQDELDDLLESTAHAAKRGMMEEAYRPSDYRIEEVK